MRRTLGVFIGEKPRRVGTLSFSAEGNRASSSFSYDPAWLRNPLAFNIDPTLLWVEGPQYFTKGKGERTSVFYGCIADSEPDGWGMRVIDRDHAKLKRAAAKAGEVVGKRILNDLDY